MAGYLDGARYLDNCGGTRSGKTYADLQFLIVLAASDRKPTVNSVVSETFPHLKKGAIRDFKDIMGGIGFWSDDNWNATDKIYTFPNGSIIEFFSADSPAKVHGPGRDRLFLNEAQNISWETARQLFIRTRNLIIIDYNPTHEFWVSEKIRGSGREKTIHSTYLDNPYITLEQKEEIERNRNDANWWRVYGLGLTGRREGLIYDFELIDRLPDTSSMIHTLGLDFGFTNDPTSLLDLYTDTRRKIVYVDQLLYRKGVHNSDIAAVLKENGIGRNIEIFADAAEPKSIAEIRLYGFNCLEAYKKDRLTQIATVQGYKMCVTKRSVETIREGRGYAWKQDADGVWLNEPIDINDHSMDALRYGIFSKFGGFKRPVTGGRPKARKAW